jgi:hypothetical protein
MFVDLAIQNGDFPVRRLLVYQRVSISMNPHGFQATCPEGLLEKSVVLECGQLAHADAWQMEAEPYKSFMNVYDYSQD